MYYKKILLTIMMLFIGTQCIMAEDLTNIKIDFKHEFNLTEEYKDLYIEISADNFSNNEYRALFTKDDSNIPDTHDNNDELIPILMETSDSPNYRQILNLDYIAKYGNPYITLYEYNGNNFNKVSNSILLNRPKLLPYTKRIIGQFYSDNSMDIKIKDIVSENSRVKFKLGEVTDLDLLKKLENPNDNAYEELIEFAKNDTNAIVSNTVNIIASRVDDSDGIYSNAWDVTKVTKDKYYYGYFVIDDENNNYYPLEDIQLYKLESNSLFASNYKSEQIVEQEIINNTEQESIVENNVQEPVIENKVQNESVSVPSTSSSYSVFLLIFGIALLVVGIIMAIKSKKIK